MIPRRITLSGFLCYRDEQVIDLDDVDLWVFTGRNGSGKSAVFDGMTYALYGAHRGGEKSRGAENLIHAERDGLSVVFEFELAGRRYRIRRSRKRNGRAEQQLFRHDPGSDEWPAVPDTSLVSGLDAWVADNIGLSYKAFTASVLLRQGEAEKLLSTDPLARFEMLAGVIDLGRYQKLHREADKRRLDLGATAKVLRTQANAAPAVGDDDVDAAARATAEAAARRDHAADSRRIAHDRLAASRHWAILAAQRDDLTRRRDGIAALLADPDAIRDQLARLRELDRVLPPIRRLVDLRTKLAEASAASDRLRAERAAITGQLDDLTRRVEAAKHAHATLESEAGADQARLATSVAALADLAVPLDRARVAQKHRDEVTRLEARLTNLAPDPAADVARFEAEIRDATAWQVALPALKRLARDRARIASIQQGRDQARHALAEAEAAHARLAADATAARESRVAARDAERTARDEVVRLSALAQEAATRARSFGDLQGSSRCDRCGQPLSADHFAAEQARLTAESAEADRLVQAADATSTAARARWVAADAAFTDLGRRLEEVARAVATHRDAVERATLDEQARVEACASARDELDPVFRDRVAPEPPSDWLRTTFPTPDDLAGGERRVVGLSAQHDHLNRARRVLADREKLLAQIEQARQTLADRSADPRDLATLEREHRTLSDEAAALRARIADRDRVLAEQGRDRDALAARAAKLEARRAEIDGQDATRSAVAREWADDQARVRADLPGAWQAADDGADADTLAAWECEQRTLRDAGVEDHATRLRTAPDELAEIDARLAAVEAQIAALTAESHRPPAEVEREVDAAEAHLQAAELALDNHRRDEDRLRRDRDDRREKEARALDAEGQLAVASELTRLLGPKALQRHLLREAERGIVLQANAILREVSGGELELRHDEEGDPEHVLRLKALVRTHGRGHEYDLAYLSGSQRFRVAVSLALGIGRYARGGRGPIGSVIIDEGFGSLDKQGRREMIDQLDELRGRLDRIILVSHQEEIADAFPNVYRFEVIDGATVAEPSRR